jgi:osmotically-inducible protein OsmY
MPGRRRPEQEISMNDQELRDIVQSALEFDPSIDAAHIGVAVEKGIVTLSGHVATYAQKLSAERTVQRLKGVRGIAQEIEVRVPEGKNWADDQIASRALSIIAWDTALPEGKVQVKVQKGWVTLSGTVEWFYQREAAERAVRKLSGVLGTSNLIEVAPSVQAGDVRERIAEALRRSAELEAAGIRIAVQGSKVTLSGTVGSLQEKYAATKAAWSAPGIAEIENRLVVG